MIKDRRKFIIAAGMAASGVALGKFYSEESPAPQASAEDDVARIVSQYGICQSVTRSSSGATDFKVKMRDHERFARIFTQQSKLPFGTIRVTAGNRLSFQHRGVEFTLTGAA